MSEPTQHEAAIEAAAEASWRSGVSEDADWELLTPGQQAMVREEWAAGKAAYDAARSGGRDPNPTFTHDQIEAVVARMREGHWPDEWITQLQAVLRAARSGEAEGDESRAWRLISAIVREAEHDDACSSPDGWRDTPLAQAIATANRQRNDLVRVLAEHPEPRQAEDEQGMHPDPLALVTQFTPRELASRLMQAGRLPRASVDRRGATTASEKTRFCSECAHTTRKHKGTKRGGTSCDVAGCRCPALPDPEDDPEDHPVTTPSDIERNTYTADRALGLHTARLAEQDQPVDRASGEESEFDFELPTDWETHGMEELDLYARHLDIDVDAIIERTGGLTKPHLVAAIRRQFEPPVEHPETGEREGMLSEADSMKAVIGTVTPRDRDVWQAGRIYEQCLAAEPLQDGGERVRTAEDDLADLNDCAEEVAAALADDPEALTTAFHEHLTESVARGFARPRQRDFRAGWLARHPHQDVEAIERIVTEMRGFLIMCSLSGVKQLVGEWSDKLAALAPSPDDRGGEPTEREIDADAARRVARAASQRGDTCECFDDGWMAAQRYFSQQRPERKAIEQILDLRDTEWATDPSDMDQRIVAGIYGGKLEAIFRIAERAADQSRETPDA